MYQRLIHRRFQNKRLWYLSFTAIIMIGISYFLYDYAREYFAMSDSYDLIIRNAAERHGVDPCLLKAVIWKESRFKPNARGSKGEIGLMQLMRDGSVIDWANAHGVAVPSEAALFIPALNVEIGAWYLARNLRKWRRYKDFEAMALAEYNAGGVVAKWKPENDNDDFISRIKYQSTRNYVVSILEKYEEIALQREAL